MVTVSVPEAWLHNWFPRARSFNGGLYVIETGEARLSIYNLTDSDAVSTIPIGHRISSNLWILDLKRMHDLNTSRGLPFRMWWIRPDLGTVMFEGADWERLQATVFGLDAGDRRYIADTEPGGS